MGSKGKAPLLFFYTHLHDAIRAELDSLSESVLQLEKLAVREHSPPEINGHLTHLRERYRFLEQVYKYHSSVEDEVVYPALDSKVRNVTLAYTVEHEDEEHLLEELSLLLSQTEQTHLTVDRSATLRRLSRKVEEVHTTLRKHLSKEEQQLLPLLLKHFSFPEQAELVAQFLCSIPLAALDPVLSWLKRSVPLAEQVSLAAHVQTAVTDPLLRQLISKWLAPEAVSSGSTRAGSPEPGTPDAGREFVCCGCRTNHDASGKDYGARTASNSRVARNGEFTGQVEHDTSNKGHLKCAHEAPDVEDVGAVGSAGGKPPLREILYFHQAIRSALSSFAEEARALVQHAAEGGGVAPAKLSALVERHRFIRAVCLFHASSEDEVVFPALRRLTGAAERPETAPASLVPAAAAAAIEEEEHQGNDDDDDDEKSEPLRHRCEDDHAHEWSQFEELGRKLGDVKACFRRGAKEVAALTEDLSRIADRLSRAMSRHMAREEADVLPVLMRSLCAAEQRYLAWRVLRAMPLRLLERVMPWVAAKLREDDVKEWLANIKRAAPPTEGPLVELLELWARRGAGVPARDPGGRSRSDDPADYANETCGPSSVAVWQAQHQDDLTEQQGGFGLNSQQRKESHVEGPALKRIKTSLPGDNVTVPHQYPHAIDGIGNSHGQIAQMSAECRTKRQHEIQQSGSDHNPIDHIFQFHKALRRELKDLEGIAVELDIAANSAQEWQPGHPFDAAIADLQARFQFLRGIYRAHSSAEDEIVFPALEAKETLHNVSHAYTLDHEQEERLFEELAQVVMGIGACNGAQKRDLPRLQILSSKLARMTAGVRASLETHVRAEEKELWPLFAENFTVEEQEHLVGVIIGRTGAEVLHTMLSWVQGSMTQEERDAMMNSLKSASKSTAFEQWLGAALEDGDANAANHAVAAHGGMALRTGASGSATPWQEEQQAVLAEVARYLAKHGAGNAGLTPAGDPSSVAADATQFRPGWEDIFRMNQKQLEIAVRRMSADASLDPQRKAYLIQHLMASRYIVAQQRKMGHSAAGSAAATPREPPVHERSSQAVAAAMNAPVRPPPTFTSGSGVPFSLALPPPPHAQQHPQVVQPAEHAAAASPHSGSRMYRRYHDSAAGILGCKHYRRRAMLVAPCCGEEHVCRLCHDEIVSGHTLDRYAVNEMRCMECGTRQPVGASCMHCKASMARYYCGICHLFDDDPDRDIYHCPFCNFCRRGKGLGVDSFHCMSCNACMSLELFNKHRCTERALSGTCPVCSDPLFESSAPIKELPCGHFMHSHCFGAYTRYSYTCPVCSKSLGDMSVYWKMIDSLLASEALPPEVAERRQTVRCNDCGIESQAQFHWVYHKCEGCGGYNTRLA